MFRFFSLLLVFIFFATPTKAQEKLNLHEWAQLPILHEGRLKPLDSFARVHLKKFSTAEHIGQLSAQEWLAEALFAPDDSAMRPIFKIRHYKDYNLPERPDRLYSYIELGQVINDKKEIIDSLLQENEKNWSQDQKSLIDIYENVTIYIQILRTLTGLLPLNISNDGDTNYLDLKNSDQLNNNKKMTALIEAGGFNNIYFRIIPNNFENIKGEWVSPWVIINEDIYNDTQKDYLQTWADMASAYRAGNKENWDKTLSKTPEILKDIRFQIEYIYNILSLLTVAIIFYLLSFLSVVSYNIISNNLFKNISFAFLSLGFVANGLDIALRIYILNRPPVGTLYESIIFVSLICVLGFLFLEKKQKNQTGLLLGSISGLLLLITARSFAGDDTMNTLVAVLNTNFWLLTHVICITIGYAICFIASFIAHYYLAVKILKSSHHELLIKLQNAIKTLTIVALLFTTIGTILGGIWADQSWGRFWGWDPKENGALLIVLWLIWLLHGRISKHINEIGFIVGTAFLSIIVVLAWFGVNLLNVGLHSYGFISGVALGITSFCVFEASLIGLLWYGGRQKPKLS